MLQWLRGRGTAEAGPRDGEAPVLEQLAAAAVPAEPIPPAPAPTGSPGALQREAVLRPLAEKVLSFHLANRFQTAYPLVLNFENFEDDGTRLLMEVAASALLSDPRTAVQGPALKARLCEAKAGPQALAALDTAIEAPRALSLLLSDVLAAGLGAHAYAVSILATGRATSTGRHHLAYLASRLGLGEDVVGSLNRRFQR